MSLSEKSDGELSKLLAEYGIKHGPIVGETGVLCDGQHNANPILGKVDNSTRKLYERKLEVAMESAPVEPSSDRTYYREEAEEITYITYSPVRVESDVLKRRGNIEPDEDEESDQETEAPVQSTNRTANHSAVRSRELDRQSGGSGWKVIRLLLLLAVLAAALYYVYCHVLKNEDNAFKSQ